MFILSQDHPPVGKFESRDNGRTPFQRDSTTNAGFTSGASWIKVNSNYKIINAAAQENDPQSVLNYFRNILKLRKNNLALVYGKYTLLDKNNPDVYAYTRELNSKKFLVLLNFKNKVSTANTGRGMGKALLLLSNYPAQATGEACGLMRPGCINYKIERCYWQGLFSHLSYSSKLIQY